MEEVGGAGGDGVGPCGHLSPLWQSLHKLLDKRLGYCFVLGCVYSQGALLPQVTAVIASVEDTLGVPSPQELAQEGTEEDRLDQEVCRLADGECSPYPLSFTPHHVVTPPTDIKEHDASPDNLEPVTEEPHPQDGPLNIEGPPPGPESTEHTKEPTMEGVSKEPSTGGVSGFLSGFAAAVQTTVSSCVLVAMVSLLPWCPCCHGVIVAMGVSLPCRVRGW